MILTVLAISLISFLGLAAGLMLSHLASEELPEVIRHLSWIDPILFASIIFLSSYRLDIFFSALISAILLLLVALVKIDVRQRWRFMICGILVILSARYGEMLIVSTLVFIYAISIATKFSAKMKQNKNEYARYASGLIGTHYAYLISTTLAFLLYLFLL